MRMKRFLMKVSLLAMAFVGIGSIGVLNQTQVYADASGLSLDEIRGIIEADLNAGETRLYLGSQYFSKERDVRAFSSAIYALFTKTQFKKNYDNAEDKETISYDPVTESYKRSSKEFEADKKEFEMKNGVKFSLVQSQSEVDSYSDQKISEIEAKSGVKIPYRYKLNSNFTDSMARDYMKRYMSDNVSSMQHWNQFAKSSSSSSGSSSNVSTSSWGYPAAPAPSDVSADQWNKAIKASYETYSAELARRNGGYGGSSIHSSFLQNSLGSSPLDNVPSFEKAMPQKYGSSTIESWDGLNSSSSSKNSSSAGSDSANSSGLSEDPAMAKWADKHYNSDLYKQDASSFEDSSVVSESKPLSRSAIIEKNEKDSNEGLKSMFANSVNVDDSFKNLLEFVKINFVNFSARSEIKDAIVSALEGIKSALQNKKGTSAFGEYVKLYKTVVGRYLVRGALCNLVDLKSYYGVQLLDLSNEINEICNSGEKKFEPLKLREVDDGKFEYVTDSSVSSIEKSKSSSKDASKSNDSNRKSEALSSKSEGSYGADNGALSQYVRKQKRKNDILLKKEEEISRKDVGRNAKKLIDTLRNMIFDRTFELDAILFGRNVSDVEGLYSCLKYLSNKDLGVDNIDAVVGAMSEKIRNRFMGSAAGSSEKKRIALNFVGKLDKEVPALIERINRLTDSYHISAEDFVKEYNGINAALRKLDRGFGRILAGDFKTKAVRKEKYKTSKAKSVKPVAVKTAEPKVSEAKSVKPVVVKTAKPKVFEAKSVKPVVVKTAKPKVAGFKNAKSKSNKSVISKSKNNKIRKVKLRNKVEVN